MSSDIQVFNYQDAIFRTYVDENGEVWLVAKDVCDFLEIANARDAVSSLDDDEKNTVAISGGNRGNPNTNVINEAGLYKLTFRSRKPEAKKFTRTVTHEILPSIRKTGSYTLPEQRKPAIKAERKQGLPQHSGIIKGAERILHKAFSAKKEQDFKEVLALDEIFRQTFGYSALEMAGLRIEKHPICVPLSYQEVLDKKRDDPWEKWIEVYMLVRGDENLSDLRHYYEYH